MTKKILIYTIKDGKFIDSLYHALGKGFNEIGRDVIYCYINEPDFAKNLSRIINNINIEFSIGQNEFGIININKYDFLKNFYATKPHVTILDDAPYNICSDRICDIECPNLLLAYRDRSHEDYLKSIKFKYKALDYIFLPFGAVIDKRDTLPSAKDIDIIFSGKYYGEMGRSWHNIKIEKSLSLLLDYAAILLENNPITVDNAVSQIIKDYNLEINKNLLFPTYKILYQYCKTYRRNRLIETIINSGIKLTVCSDTWKKSKFADKLNYQIADNTEAVLGLYKRSKILLQDMAEFNDGSHCRVADGTLCNCLLISEHSNFLQENFKESEIFLFNWKELDKLPQLISILCNNDALRNHCIDAAYKKVYDKFLPKHGAIKILEAIKRSIKASYL